MQEINNWRIEPADAVMLLIDIQERAVPAVRDIDRPVLRSNVAALANTHT